MVSEQAPTTESTTTESEAPAPLFDRRVTLEFTVEPFVDSHPGPHVQAAFTAAQAHSDLTVDIGPFGTMVSGPDEQVLKTTNEILVAAFANGATRVSLQLTAD